MQDKPLIERAASAQKDGAPTDGGALVKPDMARFVPDKLRDAFERVVAAGMKVMYSPQAAQEVMAEVRAPGPAVQKLASSTAGLVVMLHRQAKPGIPGAVIFPAAVALMYEAAQLLEAAGEPVTQEQFNEAAILMNAELGKALGVSDEEIMQGAEQALSQGAEAAPVPQQGVA